MRSFFKAFLTSTILAGATVLATSNFANAQQPVSTVQVPGNPIRSADVPDRPEAATPVFDFYSIAYQIRTTIGVYDLLSVAARTTNNLAAIYNMVFSQLTSIRGLGTQIDARMTTMVNLLNTAGSLLTDNKNLTITTNTLLGDIKNLNSNSTTLQTDTKDIVTNVLSVLNQIKQIVTDEIARQIALQQQWVNSGVMVNSVYVGQQFPRLSQITWPRIKSGTNLPPLLEDAFKDQVALYVLWDSLQPKKTSISDVNQNEKRRANMLAQVTAAGSVSEYAFVAANNGMNRLEPYVDAIQTSPSLKASIDLNTRVLVEIAQQNNEILRAIAALGFGQSASILASNGGN